MRMNKQDYLLQLIGTMDAAERRYFRLFSNMQTGEKRYLELFDALENKKEYNVAELSKELNVTPQALAVLKHYLNQVLLKSLRNYTEPTSDIAIVFRLKEEAATQMGRRLFDTALEVTDKTLTKAWELELFEIIPELLLAKHQCLYSLGRFSEILPLTEEYQKAIGALTELFILYELRVRAAKGENQLHREGIFKKILSHPIMKKKAAQLQSLKAQIAWFGIMTYRYTSTGDTAGFLKNARAEVAHYEKHDKIQLINPVGYLVSYTRLADAESGSGNFQKALDVLNKLKPLLKPSAQIKKERADSIKFYVDLRTASQLRYLERFDEAIPLLEELITHMEHRPAAEQFDTRFNYAITLFQKERLEEANSYTDQLLRIKDEVSGEAQIYLRPLMIIIHLESGNYDLVPYLIKAAKAWMKRNKIAGAEFELFFKHSYAIAKASMYDRPAAWSKMQEASAKGLYARAGKELQIEDWLKKKKSRWTESSKSAGGRL
jgi:hypothetical protein